MGPILNDYGVMGFFHSRTRPHVNRVYGLLFALQALLLPQLTRPVNYRQSRFQRSAVHNRAAAYVTAGVGIFENRL
jgi:hypothetical protein